MEVIEEDERYLGLRSREERKQLFLRYFGAESQAHTVHANQPSAQNPYEPASWPRAEALETGLWRNGTQWRTLETFLERYTVRHQLVLPGPTSTRPRIDALRSKTAYLRELLYGRDDLLLKTVPLYNRLGAVDDELLEEVYNEVQLGYFLCELIYGYSHVLSIHFMAVLDWFVLQGPPYMAAADAGLSAEDTRYHQVLVCERADVSLRTYIKAHPQVQTLRVALFQCFHALETAWWSHSFTHNDLHDNNVMLKAIGPASPLAGRHFVYKRLYSAEWYVVRAQDLHGQYVKLIDFGRSRGYVPSTEEHRRGAQHLHDRLLSPPGYEAFGYPRHKPNRHIDVQLLLFRLLHTEEQTWQLLALDDEFEQFLDFCDAMIDWKRANQLVEQRANLAKERAQHANNWLRARTMRACPLCYEYLTRVGVFVYSYSAFGPNCSDALDHAFFEPLRTGSLVDEATGDAQLNETHIVVSYVTDNSEAQALLAGSEQSQRCCVCGSGARAYITKPERQYCGRQCYEFDWLFGQRTAYREK